MEIGTKEMGMEAEAQSDVFDLSEGKTVDSLSGH